MEEKQILDKLWESYELSHSAAMEQRIELESAAKASRRIGELKREISERLLAAGEEGEGLEGLARGLDLDLDAAAQNVRRVLQLQSGLPAAEVNDVAEELKIK